MRTGELGVAVQSKYFSVGSAVTWAEPGIGAVATQSFAELSYGPRGLALMRAGKSAADALDELVAADDMRARRQVALIAASGEAATHTGAGCIPAAGHAVGDGYSCQANLMLNDTVWGAMAGAYEATAGPLAERMLAALDAAEAEGGDLRGRQSAAILVVSGDAGLEPWRKQLELRVEDHPEPLREIRRLLTLHRAFQAADRAEAAMLSGDDVAGAAAGLDEFAFLGDANVEFTRALGLALSARRDEARAIVARLAADAPGWAVAARRYAEAGIIPNQPDLVDTLTPPD